MNNFSKPAPLALAAWQTEQVALLHHFASLDYLKGLQQAVRALMVEIDPTLARLQGRDAIAIDQRWRGWIQSQNLSGNSWAFLAQVELSITADP